MKQGEQPYKIVKARPKWDKVSSDVTRLVVYFQIIVLKQIASVCLNLAMQYLSFVIQGDN